MATKEITESPDASRNAYHVGNILAALKAVSALTKDQSDAIKAELKRIAGGASGNADTSPGN